jgi:hypothetical protein
MTEAEATPAPAQGLFARAIGIIVSPKATFEKLVGAPRVTGAILLAGLAIGLSTSLPRLTESGRQAALDAQIQQTERFTGQAPTEEQIARMQQFAPLQTYGTMVFAPVGLALGLLVFAGIYFVVFNVALGGTATFKQVLAICAHSSIISAVGAVIGAPVQYFQGTASPFGPFALSALLPMLDEHTFLARFLGFINVFSIWGTIVTAIGFGVLYRRKTSSIAIGLFVLTALFAAVGATVIGIFSK